MDCLNGLDIAIVKPRYVKEPYQMASRIKNHELHLAVSVGGFLADPRGRGVVEFSCAEVKVTRAL